MNPWGRISETPIFVLTSDQDWSPEWAISRFMEEVRNYRLPIHIFRTSPSRILDDAASRGEIEQGWHPNFDPGSSHGETVEAVIDYFKKHFPGQTTVRTHRFSEDSFRLLALRRAGVIADSQTVTRFQGYLTPVVHFSGIIRLPVYFEDDAFFQAAHPALSLTTIHSTLFTPGLKILNFHPTFVGCNVPSQPYYDEYRKEIFGGKEPLRLFSGRGTLHVFRDMIEIILAEGYRFDTFHRVVSDAVEYIKRAPNLIPSNLFFG